MGFWYHGVYPGGKSGEEDDLTPADVDVYETAAGRQVAWVYFSNNWFRSRAFPKTTSEWIRARGAVPFIRLMLRSSTDTGIAEPTFTLERINKGDFDADLRAWGDFLQTGDNHALTGFQTGFDHPIGSNHAADLNIAWADFVIAIHHQHGSAAFRGAANGHLWHQQTIFTYPFT